MATGGDEGIEFDNRCDGGCGGRSRSTEGNSGLV